MSNQQLNNTNNYDVALSPEKLNTLKNSVVELKKLSPQEILKENEEVIFNLKNNISNFFLKN